MWICPDARGHIQAVGRDAADRRQYLYHPVWRRQRDAAKFDRLLEVAVHLPELRVRVRHDLTLRGLVRDRVLATAVRLLDLGCFRVGNEEYAHGENATFGLTTLRSEHVRVHGETLRFCFPAKGGIQRMICVEDGAVSRVVRALLRHGTGGDELFWYRCGREWQPLCSEDVNAYLRQAGDGEMTAKDFRTWNATVLAAVVLAGTDAGSATARRRGIRDAAREVSEYLGNTPAVARASYIDPRVIDLFQDRTTIAPTLSALAEPVDLSDPRMRAVVENSVVTMLRTGREPE